MEISQRDRIVEQTMQLFVTHGIKSVRMDDIATHVGISKRTLYEMFADKEELLYLAMECYFKRHRSKINSVAEGSSNVLEAMYIVLREVMDSSETTNRLMENLRRFYPVVHKKTLREGMEVNRREFRKMLEDGIDQGLFISQFNIDLAIAVLYNTTSALVTRRDLMLPEGITEREAFVQIMSTFFRGVATTKGLLMIDEYQKQYDPAKHRN